MPDINISLVNEHWDAETERLLWEPGPMPDRAPSTLSFLDVLIRVGVFKSKSQARKAGHSLDFPPGFTDMFVGKRRTRITIWNPVADQ